MRRLSLLLVVLAGCTAPYDLERDADLQHGRAAVDAFAGELQQTLKGAITEHGVPASVTVCRDQAPVIALAVSERFDVQLGRVSERVRNPANAPSPWQREGLALLAGEAAEPGRKVEYFARATGQKRYMRAIHVAPLCTSCHGRVIAPDVEAALEAAYPDDRARGYAPGDFRGAFYAVW